MHGADEDARESPFMVILAEAAWLEDGDGFGVPGRSGEPGEGQDLWAP